MACFKFVFVNVCYKMSMIHKQLIIVLIVKMHMGLPKDGPCGRPSLKVIDFDLPKALVVMLLQVARGLLNVESRVIKVIPRAIKS